MTRSEMVDAVYQAFKHNERDALIAALDERCQTHVAPSLPYGGVYVGAQGFGDLFADLFDIYYDSFVYDTDKVLDAGSHLIVLVDIAAQAKTGQSMAIRNAWIFTLGEASITRVELIADSAPAVSITQGLGNNVGAFEPAPQTA
jgi:ketosteroid isomerase-like protein